MSTLKVDTITNLSGSRDTSLDISVPLKLAEGAAPSSTASGYGYLYAKTDGKLYFDSDNLDDEIELTGAGVSLTSANTFTRGQVIDGGSNEIQLQIQSYGSPQAANLLEITASSTATKYLTVTGGGNLQLNSDSSVFSLGDGADFTITHDGTTGATLEGTPITINSTGDFTIDGSADIILDADGGDVKLKDGGTDFGSLTNTSGNLIIKSGTTTAATFSGANVTLAGTVGCGEITVANGSGINLQEDITFTGATTENLIKMPDNLADALNIKEGSTSYIKFTTTDSSELITFGQDVNMNGKTLDNAELQSYKEEIEPVSQGSATVTLDMNDATVFYTVLTENCTTIQFDNMVAGHSATWIVKNASAGGSAPYDVTFGTVKIGSGGSDIGKFPSGEEPQWTDTADAVDIFTFFCLDTSNILVMTGGLDFKA